MLGWTIEAGAVMSGRPRVKSQTETSVLLSIFNLAVVQWTERFSPKEQIQVRFPVARPRCK